jgi:hypothetical protein
LSPIPAELADYQLGNRIITPRRISITMEIYTQVPDEVTRVALKRLSGRPGSQ